MQEGVVPMYVLLELYKIDLLLTSGIEFGVALIHLGRILGKIKKAEEPWDETF
jgi:hypothetical protein